SPMWRSIPTSPSSPTTTTTTGPRSGGCEPAARGGRWARATNAIAPSPCSEPSIRSTRNTPSTGPCWRSTSVRGAAGQPLLPPERDPAGTIGRGAHAEHLVDGGAAGLEVERRRRHVQPPDAGPAGTDQRLRLVPVRLQVAHPRP